MVTMNQYMNSFIPLRYQVDDAQNLIVKAMLEKDFEWLLFIEHDVLIPPDAFVRINDYIRSEDFPVVSGLYFTRSIPSEPLLYRGRGTSFYSKWKFGDKVWVDGVPTGFLLVHGGLLRKMWEESEDYLINGRTPTRRVFQTPRRMWVDPQTKQFNTVTGTSDLDWSTKVMEGGFLKKSGWSKYQKMRYPFLVDTNIFCKHINMDGTQFPPEMQRGT